VCTSNACQHKPQHTAAYVSIRQHQSSCNTHPNSWFRKLAGAWHERAVRIPRAICSTCSVVLQRRLLDLDVANKEAAAANQASREVAASVEAAKEAVDVVNKERPTLIGCTASWQPLLPCSRLRRRQCMPSGSASVYHSAPMRNALHIFRITFRDSLF
jgi:hypothetical protein